MCVCVCVCVCVLAWRSAHSSVAAPLGCWWVSGLSRCLLLLQFVCNAGATASRIPMSAGVCALRRFGPLLPPHVVVACRPPPPFMCCTLLLLAAASCEVCSFMVPCSWIAPCPSSKKVLATRYFFARPVAHQSGTESAARYIRATTGGGHDKGGAPN